MLNLLFGNVLMSALTKGLGRLFAASASPDKVAKVIVVIMEALAKRTDNTVDDKLVNMLKNNLEDATTNQRDRIPSRT